VRDLEAVVTIASTWPPARRLGSDTLSSTASMRASGKRARAKPSEHAAAIHRDGLRLRRPDPARAALPDREREPAVHVAVRPPGDSAHRDVEVAARLALRELGPAERHPLDRPPSSAAQSSATSTSKPRPSFENGA